MEKQICEAQFAGVWNRPSWNPIGNPKSEIRMTKEIRMNARKSIGQTHLCGRSAQARFALRISGFFRLSAIRISGLSQV
jgi:hypothetical protein